MTNVFPQDFNWIAARATCTPTTAFIRMRTQVQMDISERSRLMTEPELAKYDFTMTATGDWQFLVSVSGPYVDKGVLFARSPKGIEVRDSASDKVLLDGVLTLANNGECKLKIGDTEYDFWQFRKMALEDVLFTSVAKWMP